MVLAFAVSWLWWLERPKSQAFSDGTASPRDLPAKLVQRLFDAAKAVNQVLDLDEVLDTILTAAREFLDGRDGSVMLVHGSDELRVVCTSGSSGASGARLKFGIGIAGQVAASRRPQLIAGTRQQPNRRLPPAAPPAPVSAMSVPLIHRGTFLGVLNLNALPWKRYSQQDLRALSIFGEQAAAAISNAQLYEAQRLLASQKSYLALHDFLTNLPNRMLFLDRAEQALRRRRPTGRLVALLFLDLDDFKSINDQLGHTAGDALLVAIAQRLRGFVRSGDTLARFGGDEFGILMEGVRSQKTALQTAQRLLQCIEEPFALAEGRVALRASIGISVETPEVSTPTTLLRQADAAKYVAKERGGGTALVFEDSAHEAVLRHLDLETRLRGAFDRGELVVYFQPVVRLDSGEPVIIEALLRWRHPDLGLLPAASFVPLAEQAGILAAIDAWVLRQTCDALNQLTSAGYSALAFSVNLSPERLRHPLIVAEIRELLAETSIPPERLMVEISERVALDDFDLTLRHLSALKDLGIRVALDDFGNGFSSLKLLQRMPVDLVKIDRIFVGGLTQDSGASDLVAAVLRLRTSLSLEVIAEGVETGAQVELLTRLGCDLGQGHLFAQPMSLKRLKDWLRQTPTTALGEVS